MGGRRGGGWEGGTHSREEARGRGLVYTPDQQVTPRWLRASRVPRPPVAPEQGVGGKGAGAVRPGLGQAAPCPPGPHGHGAHTLTRSRGRLWHCGGGKNTRHCTVRDPHAASLPRRLSRSRHILPTRPPAEASGDRLCASATGPLAGRARRRQGLRCGPGQVQAGLGPGDAQSRSREAGATWATGLLLPRRAFLRGPGPHLCWSSWSG